MNITDPIIPGVGLGGFLIDKKITEYSEIIEQYNSEKTLEVIDAGQNKILYKFSSFPLEFYVDKRTDKIYMISATKGYEGKLFETISVGMKIADIYEHHYGFYYDECDEIVLSKKAEGFSIDVGGDDPLPEDVPSLNAEAISVFNPEVFKPNYKPSI